MSSAAQVRDSALKSNGDARRTNSTRGINNNGRGAPETRNRAKSSHKLFATTNNALKPDDALSQNAPDHEQQHLQQGRKKKAGDVAGDWQERYSTLEINRKRERANAIRNGTIADPDKPRTLAEAITPVGTCQDMCAEFERVQRVVQNDVWKEERDLAKLADNPLNREPDESRMVKKFRRAAAGIEEQLPSDLRPPQTLKRTCDYLFNEVVGQADSLASVHHFVWDRTRAIRNDFSIQQISKPNDLRIAVECYERIARFHILSLHQLALPEKPYDKYDWQQEREQLDRTLLSLMQYYEDSRDRLELPNEAEFRAYSVIFQLQDPMPDLEDRVQSWPRAIALHPRVNIALRIYAAAGSINDMQGPLKPSTPHATAQQDWHKFWRLIESRGVSYLMGCVAEIYFNHVRKTVLRSLLRSAGVRSMIQWTIEELRVMMALDDEEEVSEFCSRYGLTFKDIDGGMLLDLSALKGRQLPDANATATKQTKSSLVEQKRCKRTLPAIIQGLTLQAAQKQGLIEEEDEDEMEDVGSDAQSADADMEEESSEDGLFVSEAKEAVPVSTFSSTFGKPSSSTTAAFAPPAIKEPGTFGRPSRSPFAQPLTSETDVPAATEKPSSTFGRPSVSAFGSSPFGRPSAETSQSVAGSKPHSPFTFKKRSPSPVAAKDTEPAEQTQKPAFSFFSKAVSDERTPQQPSTSSLFAPAKPTTPSKSVLGPETLRPSTMAPLTTNNDSSKLDESTNNSKPASTPSMSGVFAPAKNEQPLPAPSTTQTTAKSDLFTFPKPAKFSAISNDTEVRPIFASNNTPVSDINQLTPGNKQTSEQTAVSVVDLSTTPIATAAAKAIPSPSSSAAIPEQKQPDSIDILNQVARHVALDEDTGLLKQYVDFVLSSVITEVQEAIYYERINQEASEFRSYKLSLRYARVWREICRHKRLTRHGRGRRERANRRLHEIKSQQSAASSVTDTLSTNGDQREPSTSKRVTVDKMFQQSARSSWRSRVTSDSDPHSTTPERNAPDAAVRVERSRANSVVSRVDRSGRIVKPSQASTTSSGLGWSPRTGAVPTPRSNNTNTSYFRRKALGMDLDMNEPLLRNRKRGFSDISNTSRETSQPFSSPASSPYSINNHGESVVKPEQAVTKVRKTNADDDALFARLRAARESLAEGKDFWQTQVVKPQSPTSLSYGPTTYNSPSLERARLEARQRQALVEGDDVPAYRSRDSKFVPRDSYTKAIEVARTLRESRLNSSSRPTSRTSNHSVSGPIANGINGVSTNSSTAASPMVIEQNDHSKSTPPEVQLDESFTQPAASSDNSHTLSYQAPTRDPAIDMQQGSTRPSTASTFGTFAAESQTQAKLHPTIGHDYTIAPSQIPASLSASFRSSVVDDNHDVISHHVSAQPSTSFESSHERGGSKSSDIAVAHSSRETGGQSTNGHTPLGASEHDLDSGYADTNPFAMLQDDDSNDDHGTESEVDDDEEYDYSNGINGEDVVLGFNGEGELDEHEIDAEDEAEDENEEDEEDDESDEDEDDEEDYDDYHLAGSAHHKAVPLPNEALQAVGHNEEDAIELSD